MPLPSVSSGRKGAWQIESGPNEFWAQPLEQLLLRMATTTKGLTEPEVQSRISLYGPNDAANEKRPALWLQFLAHFRNPLVLILLAASGLSAATGDRIADVRGGARGWIDAGVIADDRDSDLGAIGTGDG